MCNPIETSCLAVVICSSVIFVLPSYSVLILIDVQYLQNVIFSFEMDSNGKNQSSSDPHISIKKSSPQWDRGGNPPYPLVLFGNSYDPMLIALAKIPECEGSISPSSFYG